MRIEGKIDYQSTGCPDLAAVEMRESLWLIFLVLNAAKTQTISFDTKFHFSSVYDNAELNGAEFSV